jgi:asparagine synthase (glutamine-hydrolysing)
MCGIAGYAGSAMIAAERIETTLGLMRRRGPDCQNHVVFHHGDRNVYLLHSRLSIIDLGERANQPYRLGPLALIYNGELYNYIEVKQHLKEQGCGFETTSDTEVLIKTLDLYGWRGLDRCEGMWAFVLHDSATGTLLLARDRFGEKPLFLYRDESGIYFGSEVKFILALLGRRLDVNLNHLHRYLVNGYKALYKTRETFFRGVEELSPATVLEIDSAGAERTHRYWAPRFQPDDRLTYEQAVDGARAALLKSIGLRLRADVPLAFCMSGGVDSNALISIAKIVHHYDVHGFTIVNTDARYEEQDVIEASVAALKIRHTPIPVATDGFLPRMRTLVRQHDAPVCTITYFAHWLLMESIAAHGYRISVSGTAADELFTGYYDHHLAYLYEVRNEPELHAASRRAWLDQIRPMVRNPYLRNPELFIENPTERGHIFLEADEFARYLTTDWSEPFEETRYTGSLLRNRMLNEMFHEAVPVILHEDDLNAMYFSIENRSPFLDRELFEFCHRIPSRHLIRHGHAKSVLRDAMRGIVPNCVLDNPRKVGFNAPIFSFLDVRNSEVRASLLDESPIFKLVKRERIESLINKPDLPNSESKFLFYFLASKMFLEEFGAVTPRETAGRRALSPQGNH